MIMCSMSSYITVNNQINKTYVIELPSPAHCIYENSSRLLQVNVPVYNINIDFYLKEQAILTFKIPQTPPSPTYHSR